MKKGFNLKEEYERLRKQYSLPDFKILDSNFEISNLDLTNLNKEFLIRVIRRRIMEKIIWIVNTLQNILIPNTNSMVSMQESRFFDDNDKDKVIKIIRRLMLLEREALLLDVNSNNKEEAEFINKILKDWLDMMQNIEKIFGNLHDGWQKTEKEEFYNYFG